MRVSGAEAGAGGQKGRDWGGIAHWPGLVTAPAAHSRGYGQVASWTERRGQQHWSQHLQHLGAMAQGERKQQGRVRWGVPL